MTNPLLWHRWFAWYPVHFRGQLFWLETIQCRKIGAVAPDDSSMNGDLTYYWEYQRI